MAQGFFDLLLLIHEQPRISISGCTKLEECFTKPQDN